MTIVQIFLVTVPIVVFYIYQFMVLLRSKLEKNTFFPVFEVLITKVIVCLFNQLLFREQNLGLYLCNKRKTKIMFLKLFFLVASKTSQNLNISCTFYVSTMKSCLSSNLKKNWTKRYIDMSYKSLKVNLNIFQL